ncbi:MAG: amidohydrolase family protein [Betaproteobacteria bacterium]|nr:MAG: amidohydrolase family protein [Betaproteobacteria bacterium]
MRAELALRCALALTSCLAGQVMADPLPLFDGHIHYNLDAPERYPPQAVVRILDEAGITGALLSSTPNDGTHLLYERYPQRFIPALRPYRKTRDFETWRMERGNWYRDPATVMFIEQELERGIYRGIGEFHANGDEAATPQMRAIARLAEGKGLWLHAHSDAAAVEHLFAHAPSLTIIWAHAGMSTPPAEIDRMLAAYPRLVAELSYRDVVASSGKLDPLWRALFLKYPDRFIYGSDTWMTPRWEAVVPLAQSARAWLGELPEEIAEKIAFGNAQRIFSVTEQ